MKVLTENMQDVAVGSYAHSWHCCVAMSVYDELDSAPWVSLSEEGEKERHKTANAAASRFMRLCFGVDTKNE